MQQKKQKGYCKTTSVVSAIINAILTYGGIATVLAFGALQLNTAFVFESQKIHFLIRAMEVVITAEMLLFYISYNRDLGKKIKNRKEGEKCSFHYNVRNIVRAIEREHIKIKVDMLFAGILTYVGMIVAMRIVSYFTIKYATYLALYHSQTLILLMLHVGALAVPALVWNKNDVNAHLVGINNITYTPIKNVA